jgi:hypothetical protein
MERNAFWKAAVFYGVSVLSSGSAVALAIHASGRTPRPAQLAVTHTVSSPEFGVKLTLPSTWNFEPGHSGMNFVATHSETGATLMGTASASELATSKESIIERIVEEQRAHSGTVENVSRGVMASALVNARWVSLSYPSKGGTARMKTVAVAFQRGRNTLTLTCTEEGRVQPVCEPAIRSVTMAH